MAFREPTFPLAFNLWRNTSLVTGPPDLQGMCNLAFGENAALYAPGYSQFKEDFIVVWMLFPKRTDVRPSSVHGNAQDCVEVPAGTGRFYLVVDVDDVGRGFTNEYRKALCAKITQGFGNFQLNPWGCPDWPLPIP